MPPFDLRREIDARDGDDERYASELANDLQSDRYGVEAFGDTYYLVRYRNP